MSRRSVVPVVSCLMVALLVATGCGGGREQRAGGPSATPSSSPAATPATESPIIGATYLDRDDCVRELKGAETGYPEVACDDPRALAKVLSRYLVDVVPGLRSSECHDDTDLLVDMRKSLAVLGEHTRADQGYACLRNLKPPHPSDPGRGGGARVRVGDCVTVTQTTNGGLTRMFMGAEVPCARSERDSTYRIVKITWASRHEGGDCPDSAEQFSPSSLTGGSTDSLEKVDFFCAVKR